VEDAHVTAADRLVGRLAPFVEDAHAQSGSLTLRRFMSLRAVIRAIHIDYVSCERDGGANRIIDGIVSAKTQKATCSAT
jgi:DUF917 family protein